VRTRCTLRRNAGLERLRTVQRRPVAALHHRPRTQAPAQLDASPTAPAAADTFPEGVPGPGVMQGCLESTSGLIMGVDSKSGLVAERTTGAVKEISVSAEPKVKTVIPVDPSGDGGLMDIVLSPTYSQDRLMYAYISTPTDTGSSVADGDIPKDILTGIPKGAVGNTGALVFTSPTTLVVLTGDAGNPAMAADPKSLAGKVLRHRAAHHRRRGASDNGTVRSRIGRRVVHRPRRRLVVCRRSHPHRDRLQRITKTSEVSTVWTWPDKPAWPAARLWTGQCWSTWSTPN